MQFSPFVVIDRRSVLVREIAGWFPCKRGDKGVRVIIQVTRQHIEDGKRLNAQQCPVSLAIKEHLPRYMIVSTISVNTVIRWEDAVGYNVHYLDLDADVTDFIRLYDGKMDVDPIEFDLPIERFVNEDA